MSKSLASFGKSDIEEMENIDVNSSESQIVPSTSVATKAGKNIMFDQNILSVFSGAIFSGNVTINVQINK